MKYATKQKFWSALLCFLLLGFGSVAQAAILNYSIVGAGSGSLGGESFVDASFTISMSGDASLFNGVDINPLINSSVSIDGFGTAEIDGGTRLGINGSIIFFSRSSGFDLFDFYLAAPVDLTQPFGPLSGTGVFALYQFDDVGTSLGLLSLNSSSDVLFQASNVPEPAVVWLLCSGLAGLLAFKHRYNKKT